MLKFAWLSIFASGELSLQDQTGWEADEIVNVRCPESGGGDYQSCSIACDIYGANNTVGFYNDYCLKKLKAGSALLVTRDRRYGTGGGKIVYRDGLGDIYHINKGFMWGLELAAPVDLSHWERITKATLYLDEIDSGSTLNGGERNVISQTPVNIYRAQVQTPHYKNNQGRNNYMLGLFDNNAYVNNLNLAHPDYVSLGWETTENVFKALNLTQFVRREAAQRGDLGPGLVIHQPSLEKSQSDDQMGLTGQGTAASLYLDIHEEVWVVADTHCRSMFTCAECKATEGCFWCFTSNLKNLCSDHCDDLWNNDDACSAESTSTSSTSTSSTSTSSTSSTSLSGSSSSTTESSDEEVSSTSSSSISSEESSSSGGV